MAIAPLRRLDWRFLLPPAAVHPRAHVVLIGAGPGLATRLRDAGIVRQVSSGLPAAGELADLVAVLGGGRSAVGRAGAARAAAALRPGGVLYVECRTGPGRRATGSPRAVAAAIRRAGLEVVGRYAILPRPDAAKVYLPLDAPGAFRWVVETLVPASTPARRAVREALRAVGVGPTGLALRFYPYQALVAVRPPVVEARAATLALAAASGDAPRPAPLVLCDAGNRVVILPFPPGAREPLEVLKVPKLPVFNGRTRNEQQRLAEIRGAVPRRLLGSLPEPGWIRDLDGGVAVASESYRRGIPLMTSSGAWRASWRARQRDLERAAAWLTDFHRSTRLSQGRWDAEQRARWIEEPLREYASAFGTNEVEERLFTDLRQRAASLEGRPFPTVWWHRDFNIWNLFRDGERLVVIDWEGARPGPPLCDLLHFSTHWYEAVRHLRTEEAKLRGFRDLFVRRHPDDRPAAAVDSAIAAYLGRLGLDRGFVPVLLCFTWIELALRRAEQLRDQAQEGTDAREGNRNFAFVAALAEAAGGSPRGRAGPHLSPTGTRS